MKVASFEAIVRALNEARVSFMLDGGLAVVTHGFRRNTEDVDLVVHLDREQILRTFAALAQVSYRPRVPITAEQFADSSQRESWIREKEMFVLNF